MVKPDDKASVDGESTCNGSIAIWGYLKQGVQQTATGHAVIHDNQVLFGQTKKNGGWYRVTQTFLRSCSLRSERLFYFGKETTNETINR